MISGETAGIKSAYPYGRSGSEWAIRTVDSDRARDRNRTICIMVKKSFEVAATPTSSQYLGRE
jgi:hypothetical protein